MDSISAEDPIFPWLRSIETVLEEFHSDAESSFSRLEGILGDCIRTFMNSDLYRDDVRFLKIWILYADVTQDVEKVYLEMEDKQIGISHSLLYEAFAFLMESKGNLVEALSFYQLGISRKAEPLERLKKMHKLFLNRISDFVDSCSNKNQKGFHRSLKKYAGKVPLNSLHTSSRNKVIELGGRKYQIKGCSGQGAFARVYKAFENSNPDDVVALKIQTPPFPWEFYMYRQLDMHISDDKRSSFGVAHRLHAYADWSILVCDFKAHGTLQDAINSYLVTGHCMEEELCIYYTLEMLHMLETLHSVGIIHGDFKPDNLLVRYARYWKVDLWKNLFSTLLNSSSHGNDPMVLRSLRETFEDHVCGDSQMIRKLKQLLVKQRASLCSS
ncbi:3-phosphoinositide-dependent protein kinase 1 [Acorus calamus]|uniref:3-phosphoinositide-dependent protein kinase 1 n=1 Tax=Acorus calamus TaxID=4465 RepID=A0AAV9FHF8_ACOCL|nr:3-phosphoinositide-dependent protein kinase 1 [Acorus calamus]